MPTISGKEGSDTTRERRSWGTGVPSGDLRYREEICLKKKKRRTEKKSKIKVPFRAEKRCQREAPESRDSVLKK